MSTANNLQITCGVMRNKTMNKQQELFTDQSINADGDSRQVDLLVGPKMGVPDWVKEIAVECNNIKEFAYTYRKAERFLQLGREYVSQIMGRHLIELADYGYTLISKHESTTGNCIAYVGKESDF